MSEPTWPAPYGPRAAHATECVLAALLVEPNLYRPWRIRGHAITCELCNYTHGVGCVVLVRDESKRTERPFLSQAVRCNCCAAWLDPATLQWKGQNL